MPTTIPSQPLLTPVIALVVWTFVMEAWMYALRLPALSKYHIDTSPAMTTASMNAKIPRHLQWPADNYNHLHEQPTLFYAVALALNQLGVDDGVTVGLAWMYVGLRVVHSVVQASRNPIMVRFQVFAASSFVLLGLTVKAAIVVM
ncbi:hypothetical protein LTR36_001967 [Oleoguttula mirabilis]|uniref:MAPEG family protein n=1 Tax=Oleoguttula mirabilis TaxID=1507867 RepID=A0AAV9JMR0_9PEZI|nr:hypothetical protein LTR36_001967 [Oleoguttula mirabilis]